MTKSTAIIPNSSSSRETTSDSRRWLALAIAVAITLTGGALYGSYSQRWGPPPDLARAASHLETFPTQIGSWKMAEERPIEKSALEMLECAGYVHRQYIHETSGQWVNLVIVVGPPGPTAVHTPEICFSSRAYKPEGERHKVVLRDSATDSDSFWRVDFQSRNALAEDLIVYYAWSLGRTWEASRSPRYEFGGAPLLYKIQLAASGEEGIEGNQSDRVRAFLDDLHKSGWQLTPS